MDEETVEVWETQEKQVRKRTWNERKKGLTRPRTKVFYLTEDEFAALKQYLEDEGTSFQSLIIGLLEDEGII
jgi:hypothetical protein